MHPALPRQADRLLVVLSDIEMGAGGVFDDFLHDEWLADLIVGYNRPPYDGLAVDLVLNGDTFDLLKTPLDGGYPRHISSEVAQQKLQIVMAAHPRFLQGLREFMAHASAARRVHFLIGNHDFELLFTTCQKAIRHELGSEARVYFHGFRLRIGDCHIEHGMQQDSMFTLDEATPLVQYQGRPILNLPWGNVALLDVAMPLHRYLFQLDRTKPRNMVFSMVPEVKELIVNAYWRYWTTEYVRDWVWGTDPIKRMSWTIFRELIYRFGTYDTTMTPSDHFRHQIENNDDVNTFVVGHNHQPGWWSFGNRKVLHSGCLRDEFMVGRDGFVQHAIPKVYAEVYLADDRVVRSHLVEVEGPPSPLDGYMPASVYEVVEGLKPLLLEQKEDDAAIEARQLQEKREASE